MNSRYTVSLSLFALCRSIHPMPSFDPPSSVSEFVYIIRGVHLDAQDMSNSCNLIHSKAINHFPLPHTRDRGSHD